MKYVKMGLKNGTKLDEEHINHIEDGISRLFDAISVHSANVYVADREELEETFGTADIALANPYFDAGATHVLDIASADVNAEYIFTLYDKLLGITSKEDRIPVKNDAGETVTYEYVISTGDYNTAGERGDRDTDIKKAKYLVLNCIHGSERAAALSAYWFFKDLVEGKRVPHQFRDGAEFHVIPVGNQHGANVRSRYNAKGVDINRNFDFEWSSEVTNGRDPGDFPGSEDETQAIMNWLKANADAELFIDFHNSTSDGKDENGNTIWVINEVAMIVGLNTEEMKAAKQTALRGLDRVIPHWRDVIGYTAHNLTPPPETTSEPWGEPDMRKPVFSYSSYYEIPGASVYYAADKLGIPSLCLECSGIQNADLSDYRAAYPYTPETIAAGAESLGNILLEFYDQHLNGEYCEDETSTSFFDIDYDGIVSLKPEYRGQPTNTTYPYAVSDNGVGNDGSRINELPKKLVIPDVIDGTAVTGFQPGAFHYNYWVEEIVLPDGVTELPDYFTRYAINLRSVQNTEQITKLGSSVFGYTRIEKMILPNLKEVVNASLGSMSFLRIVDIGNHLTALPKQFLGQCYCLSAVRGGESVTSIGEQCFWMTKNLKNLPLLDHVTSIGVKAFVQSRVQYKWKTSGCSYGTNSTPIQDNTTDYWSGINFAEYACTHHIAPMVWMSGPEWKGSFDATVFDIMCVHSTLSGENYSDPRVFCADKGISGTVNFDDLDDIFAALGHTAEVKPAIATQADYVVMLEAIRNGAYIISEGSNSNSVDKGSTFTIFGINDIGEVLVSDPDYRFSAFGDPKDYLFISKMPYQNLSSPNSRFVIVT